MTITGVDLTQGTIQAKPFSPVDIFATTLGELPDPAEHEGALVYVPGTGLLLSDGTAWGSVTEASATPNFGPIDSSYKLQAFSLKLVNNGGTLQHQVSRHNDFSGGLGGGTPDSGLVDRFNGLSNTLTNTPTGADASTAFAAGLKIGNPGSNRLVLDCLNEQDIRTFGSAFVHRKNGEDTDITVLPMMNPRDVNGVTKIRLELDLIRVDFPSVSTQGFSPASLLAADEFIVIHFWGFVK